jgi:hypothetical protein
LGGWWWLYHRFSIQVTNEEPPWSRTHSTERVARLSLLVGAVNACP